MDIRMNFTEDEQNRIIQMAWEDRTPFEAIRGQFGLTEGQVIDLMRRWSKPSSFRMWRRRMAGRATKHAQQLPFSAGRMQCSRQRSISSNRISKRRS